MKEPFEISIDLDKANEDLTKAKNLIEIAWTIIASVDWQHQHPLWRKSAEMWRDKHYFYLREHKEDCDKPVCGDSFRETPIVVGKTAWAVTVNSFST